MDKLLVRIQNVVLFSIGTDCEKSYFFFRRSRAQRVRVKVTQIGKASERVTFLAGRARATELSRRSKRLLAVLPQPRSGNEVEYYSTVQM